MKMVLTVATLLLFTSLHGLYAKCITQLIPAGNATFVPLPPSCRSLGPIELGLTKHELFAVMGHPDGQFREPYAADDVVVYVLPRNFNANLAKHPRTRQYFYAHQITISAAIHKGRVVFIEMTGVRSTPSTVYGTGVMSIGGNVDALLEQLKIEPGWNNSHDAFNLFPYPIFINTLPYKGTLRVVGISIANSWDQSEAPSPFGFTFVYVPSTDLIHKYKLNVPCTGLLCG